MGNSSSSVKDKVSYEYTLVGDKILMRTMLNDVKPIEILFPNNRIHFIKSLFMDSCDHSCKIAKIKLDELLPKSNTSNTLNTSNTSNVTPRRNFKKLTKKRCMNLVIGINSFLQMLN
jgi:hypothetical protein